MATKKGPKAGARASKASTAGRKGGVNRILVGVRIEPRLVKVMKALAELHDLALGELLERVFWNAMDGTSAFAEKGKIPNDVKQQIQNLKQVYGVNYALTDLAKQ